MKEETIGFIGLGNMAGALIKGLRASKRYASARIIGYDRNADKREAFHKNDGVEEAADARAAARDSDVLVLAIKPQGMDALLADIKDSMKERGLVISLAAGKTLAYFEEALGTGQAVARAMPNINARALASMTGISHNSAVSEKQLETAVSLFDALGSVSVMDEAKLPAFSAIAGAGPAFAFAFIDALAAAGVRFGLTRALAQQAACAMLFGSATLVAESGEHPRALIDQVTSPGGTTIEGMHALARLGFEHAVQEAVAAVIDKENRMA